VNDLDPWGDVTDTKPAQKEFHKVWFSISFETIGKIFRKITGREPIKQKSAADDKRDT